MKRFAHTLLMGIFILGALVLVELVSIPGFITAFAAPENFHWVSGTYASSGQPYDWMWVRDQGFKHVINFRAESDDPDATLAGYGIRYHRIPIIDHTPPTINQIAQFAEIIEQYPNDKILGHCAGGSGRAPIFALAYMVKFMGYRTDGAYDREMALNPNAWRSKAPGAWDQTFEADQVNRVWEYEASLKYTVAIPSGGINNMRFSLSSSMSIKSLIFTAPSNESNPKANLIIVVSDVDTPTEAPVDVNMKRVGYLPMAGVGITKKITFSIPAGLLAVGSNTVMFSLNTSTSPGYTVWSVAADYSSVGIVGDGTVNGSTNPYVEGLTSIFTAGLIAAIVSGMFFIALKRRRRMRINP